MRSPRRPRQHDQVLSRALSDRLLLYATHKGRLHELTQTATSVWDLCDGKRTVRQILAQMTGRYDAPRSTIERDVHTLLRKLTRAQLINWSVGRQ